MVAQQIIYNHSVVPGAAALTSPKNLLKWPTSSRVSESETRREVPCDLGFNKLK